MFWFCCWMLALSTGEPTSAELTDWMKPINWSGNYWGPAATRARMSGQLPPLAMTPAMTRWSAWGRKTLREGDIVFRLGDARIMRGSFPLSLFIARASGSPFSHTGIVAIEDGSPVVYDCALDGIQRQTFEVWMLECVGEIGVKRLKAEQQHRIPGVIEYCRKVYEQQVPFDSEFRMDDAALYCVEMTEKAFRSQGLALSEPVRIGDWENLADYTLTALAIPRFSGLFVDARSRSSSLCTCRETSATACGRHHCSRRYSARNCCWIRRLHFRMFAACACRGTWSWLYSWWPSCAALTQSSRFDGFPTRSATEFSGIARSPRS